MVAGLLVMAALPQQYSRAEAFKFGEPPPCVKFPDSFIGSSCPSARQLKNCNSFWFLFSMFQGGAKGIEALPA